MYGETTLDQVHDDTFSHCSEASVDSRRYYSVCETLSSTVSEGSFVRSEDIDTSSFRIPSEIFDNTTGCPALDSKSGLIGFTYSHCAKLADMGLFVDGSCNIRTVMVLNLDRKPLGDGPLVGKSSGKLLTMGVPIGKAYVPDVMRWTVLHVLVVKHGISFLDTAFAQVHDLARSLPVPRGLSFASVDVKLSPALFDDEPVCSFRVYAFFFGDGDDEMLSRSSAALYNEQQDKRIVVYSSFPISHRFPNFFQASSDFYATCLDAKCFLSANGRKAFPFVNGQSILLKRDVLDSE